MEEIVTILSTREWAITIWGTGFFIWMLTQSEIRKSLWNVIKILLGKNLRRFFLIIALYVAGITMIFYQLPFWNNIYLKDIILWLIFSGISYCVNSIIKGDTEHLKSTVKDNFRVIVIFEYFIGTFTFKFWIEMLIIPVITILTLMNVVAESEEKYRGVHKLKVSRESLYDRISKCLINNKKYNEAAFPKEIRRYIPLNYNASTKIKAVDTRASKSCSGLFLEVLGLYCNNKNYDPAEAKCAYSKSSQILKLSEEEIDSNCEKVCIAMDRAFAFLQIRCGVQSLSDVNYKLMIRLIAYIFTNDKWYGSEKVHDIIEAWYWAAIFSGEYDKDQNERFEKNLRSILETLTTKAKKYDWIITLKNNIFETPYFSDCSFLLMEKANEDRIPKEHLAKYICQFYLSRTYSDLIHDDRQINVFSKYKLEKHHIVPVGSVSKIGESTDILRKDKTNIVNSPLNYVFISDATNLEISNISLKEYEQDITASAKAALNIVNYPSVEKLNDKTTIKAWLKERYKILKGQIQNRVMNMLLS